MVTDLTAVTRLEKILANLTGEAYDITPATRIEKLFDNLLDGSYAVIPATRIEKFIADLKDAGYDLTAVTRIEKFLNKTASEAGLVPVTRLEKFLDAIEAGGIDWGNPYPGSVYEPLTANMYIQQDGSELPYKNRSITNYVYCKGATSVLIKPAKIDPKYCQFYDADKTPLGRFGNTFVSKYSVPAGACYFKLSSSTSSINSVVNGSWTVTPLKE